MHVVMGQYGQAGMPDFESAVRNMPGVRLVHIPYSCMLDTTGGDTSWAHICMDASWPDSTLPRPA